MTLSWALRFVWVWLWMIFHGAQPATCERVYDMDPRSSRSPGKSYEEWYGSPMLICESARTGRSIAFCLGPNC